MARTHFNGCWTQQEKRDNQGLISTGNYKFRSVKLELGVSGYMDILILNTYILYRRGEWCWSCVGQNLDILTFCSYGVPFIGKKSTWDFFSSSM